jgi:uncharacterized membrane protein
VIVEGFEVIFAVIALGAGGRHLSAASLGALTACFAVALAGLALRRPLARVPENTLKFGVGVMLSAFGIFWAGEGLGAEWPGGGLAVMAFVLAILAAGLAAVLLLRRRPAHAGQ